MPHQSLALRHLSKLPVAIRRRAQDALNGNTDELRALNGMIHYTPTATYLLPLYYAGLDVAEMPSLLARLDSEAEQDLTSVVSKLSHIVVCIEGIMILDGNRRLPAPASVDLWERAWPWIEFLGTHRDTLPHIPVLSQVNPLSLVDALVRDNQDTAALVRATPGFLIYSFRAWALCFDQARLTPITPAFEIFCTFIQDFPLTITDERDFAEAIEGSGGNRILLARLCVNHVKCVAKSNVITGGVSSMQSVIMLLQRRCEVDESFRKILIDEGVVTALTSAACRFSVAFAAHDQYFNLSWAVRYYLNAPFGHDTATEALRAGLLRAVLTWGRMSPPKPQALQQLEFILEILSGALVYLSTLAQFRTAVTELGIPIDGHTFQGFPISDTWEAFWSLLQSRWALMETHLKREKAAAKAVCHNVACSLIATKSDLKRCSGCSECRYCSKECQKMDWRHGGHRQTCEKSNDIGKRDGSFLLALLDDDYSKMKPSILMKEVVYMRSSPDTDSYVLFDYCTPYSACAVSVEDVNSFKLDGEVWRRQTKRARESGGRVQIHVMRLADGGCDAIWVFPLYSASAERREGVQALAVQTPLSDENEQRQADGAKIKSLAELDILELHL
ncbi:hypothetical protein B0H11DRAFT_2122338 [Mycena galericulata]|nr:hypothetical protein B0H11DRAFT_2122338 [Mycena galericulata]